MTLALAASLSRFRPLFSSMLLVITVATSHCLAATTVKVGVYQDFPLVFYDDRGISQGVYVDLLEHIDARENWSIEYVPSKWADCLVQLETGTIDLLTAIAYSNERSEIYDFNAEIVFPNWGQVYSEFGTNVESIADLAGKSVAGLSKDIYSKTLQEVTEKAGAGVTYVSVDEYDEVFRRIKEKQVDSGIVPRRYGDLNEKNFNVQKTTTIVQPSELRLAAQKEKNKHLGVRFLHKEQTDDQQVNVEADTPLPVPDLRTHIASMPSGLLDRLSVVTDSCNADEIDRIISEIRTHNDHLGVALMVLARKFVYQEIMGFIDTAKDHLQNSVA